MVESYPARYQDVYGAEDTIIDNDGKRLRMLVRGVEFVGTDFDALDSTLDPADPRLTSFTLYAGSLCTPPGVGHVASRGHGAGAHHGAVAGVPGARSSSRRGQPGGSIRKHFASASHSAEPLSGPAGRAEAILKMSCATSSKRCQRVRISKRVSLARSPIIPH